MSLVWPRLGQVCYIRLTFQKIKSNKKLIRRNTHDDNYFILLSVYKTHIDKNLWLYKSNSILSATHATRSVRNYGSIYLKKAIELHNYINFQTHCRLALDQYNTVYWRICIRRAYVANWFVKNIRISTHAAAATTKFGLTLYISTISLDKVQTMIFQQHVYGLSSF